jgi:membrane protein DedA with SNARE-associated domain
MTNPISAITSWAVDVVETFGYVGIFLMVTLENLVPPIPSEIILPLAGFLVGQDGLSFLLVLASATLGSVVGALILYALGRWLGEDRMRGLARRYGKYLLLNESDLDQPIQWFASHGQKAVLGGRLVPGVRSLISVPAGIVEMPIARFVVLTALGSGIWNAGLIGAGWLLGRQWHQVEQYTSYLEYAVIAAVLCAVIWFVWRRRDRVTS